MSEGKRRKNIFVLGYNRNHSGDIRAIPDADKFEFHPLLYAHELVYLKRYSIDEKLDKARTILKDFSDPVDGLICHWDFPAISLAAILCEEFDLKGPSLEAVTKCSHKYWSRLEQAKAAPDNVPDFSLIDPFADDPLESLSLDFPFWMKPIKGYSSALGFQIKDENEFRDAIEEVREKIRRIGDPFNDILKRLDLPEEVGKATGNHMLAEQLMQGVEFAPEGSVSNGHFAVHGVVDMVRGENRKSFQRYEYPSQVPRKIQQRGIEVAEKVLKQMEFDNGCFNMEFFWNKKTDELLIIEINPRVSQSHCYQFEKVDGASNHEIAIHVALGDTPEFEPGAGPFNHAAKFMLRLYRQGDARVTRIPSDKELKKLRERFPDAEVLLLVEEDQKLSELLDQDAYSYVLAEVYVAGDTAQEMRDKYQQAVDMLPFEFEDLDDEDR